MNPKVCGYHFKDDAFINPEKKNEIKNKANPTLFVDHGKIILMITFLN